MAMLITASLLDGFDWMLKAKGEWTERAKIEFIDTINRTKTFEPTPEIQRGIDFERLLCDTAERVDSIAQFRKEIEKQSNKAVAVAMKFVPFLVGSTQQVQVKKNIKVDDDEFYFFGYADLIAENGDIYDIKTTSKFWNDKKYIEKNQHSVYQYCRDHEGFKYLVADFAGGVNPKNFYEIDASRDPKSCELFLQKKIREMRDWLKANNLWGNYIQNFCKGRV